MTATASIVQQIRDKAGITEEVEKQINKMQSGTLGITQSMDIVVPVTNGHGLKNVGSYTNPFPWSIKVSATGKIVLPKDGTWRILIKLNGHSVFDKSKIAYGEEFHADVSIPGWQSSNVTVEVWWSTGGNTDLKVHVVGSI